MALKRWYVDLREIDNDKAYNDAFDILDQIAYGNGLHPTPLKKVFTCTLDAEENAGLLRDLDQYLRPDFPET